MLVIKGQYTDSLKKLVNLAQKNEFNMDIKSHIQTKMIRGKINLPNINDILKCPQEYKYIVEKIEKLLQTEEKKMSFNFKSTYIDITQPDIVKPSLNIKNNESNINMLQNNINNRDMERIKSLLSKDATKSTYIELICLRKFYETLVKNTGNYIQITSKWNNDFARQPKNFRSSGEIMSAELEEYTTPNIRKKL
jgi:hypothetical protein